MIIRSFLGRRLWRSAWLLLAVLHFAQPAFTEDSISASALSRRLSESLHEVISQDPGYGAIGQLTGPGDINKIILGDSVSIADQLRLGLVSINGGGCSGALLANDWAITAGHCFAAGLPRSATVTLNGVTMNSAEIYVFGQERLAAGGNDQRGPDVALIHTVTPFTINGSTSGFRTDVARVDGLDLRNAITTVYGQGLNQIAAPGVPASGAGRFRVGILQITPESMGFQVPLLEAKPIINPGPVCFFGDSGGPMFVSLDGRLQIAAVVQTGDMDCTPSAGPCTQLNTTAVRSCKGPKLFDMWEAFPDIISTRWNAAATTQLFDVGGAEWATVPWLNGSIDVNAQPWDVAARSANSMCYNRGFVGGMMNGHQLNSKFGLACSGAGSASWRDVSSSQINATPWPFARVDTATWAQANRTAARLCEQAGTVGGHFNGHIVPNPSGAGSLMGLICYAAPAQKFDITAADIAGPWQFSNPDQVPGRRPGGQPMTIASARASPPAS